MWYEINNSSNPGYHLKYFSTNNVYYFYLTNFIHIWENQSSRENLISILKHSNPLIEAQDDDLLDSLDMLCQGLADQKAESQLHIKPNQEITLSLRIRNKSIVLRITLDFSPSNSETYCEQIVLPLVKKLKQLQSSEDRLVDLISKKDLEISEYKAEGAVLPLKHLETAPFDKEKYTVSHNLSITSIPSKTLGKVLENLQKTFGDCDESSSNKSNEGTSVNSEKKLLEKLVSKPIKSECKVKIKEEKVSPLKRESTCLKLEEKIKTSIVSKKPRKRLLNF